SSCEACSRRWPRRGCAIGQRRPSRTRRHPWRQGRAKRMSGHISLESLSAYLDGETGPSETGRLEAHLAACAPCSSRLEATRRVVGGLRVLRPTPPPPDLPARLEGRIAAERAGAGGRRSLRSVRSWLWWQGLPPLHG